MNMEWHALVNDTGATHLQVEGSSLCGLMEYGLLKVSGQDAATFLQGQTTCDVNAVEPGRIEIGALCTPKGRVIANFRLLRSRDGFYLLLAADLAEAVRKRLQMFVLRSKVVVENLTPRYGMIGLFSMGALSSIESVATMLPNTPGTWLEEPDRLIVWLDDGSDRCLIAAELDAARQLWADLSSRLPRCRPDFWRLKDIEAGYPAITVPTSEEFLPQMLNLDALGGISFQKGCYTGQEIVTRTHFLGQVKRRMFRLRCGGGSDPVPGTPIIEISEIPGREPRNLGQVVISAPESTTDFQLLAVVTVDYAGNSHIHVGRPDGPLAEWLPLPYPLPAS